MELIPVARRGRNRNTLQEVVDRADFIFEQTTPEADPVDPSIFSPIDRNPQAVNDAITALANSRVEGSIAADELRRRQFDDQLNQLILSQFLGLGGAIANLGGSQIQTGVDERANAALPTALGLRQQLTDQLIRGVEDRASIRGEAGVQTARLTEEARIANEEDSRRQQQLLMEATIKADERARKEGGDRRQILQQEIANAFQEESNRQGRERNAISRENAVTARINALRPRSTGRGSVKIGEKGFVRGLLDDARGNRSAAETAFDQVGRDSQQTGAGTAAEFAAREGAAREQVEREQLVAENLAQMRGALTVAPMDEVGEVFGELFEMGDNQFILPVIDELQTRLRRNPNDPMLKSLESQINEGLPADQAVSLQDFLNRTEQLAEANSLRPLQ